MAVGLAPFGNDSPFILQSGVAASGYKLFIWLAGSTTKATSYSDSAGTVSNANPILTNAAGNPASSGNRVAIWLTTGQTYKWGLYLPTDTDPPTGAPVAGGIDNIPVINDTTSSQNEWVTGPAPTFINGTQFSLAGDQTGIFKPGRRTKTTNTAGTIFSGITTSVFTTLTTITVQNDSGALDSGLSAVSYSLLASDNSSVPHTKFSTTQFGVQDAFALAGVVSPAQIIANQNDYNPASLATVTRLRLSTSARWNITGLAGGVAGRMLIVHNVGTFPMVFTIQDALSAAANRFAFGVTLGGAQSMTIQYDETSSLWRPVSLPPGPIGQIIPFAGGTVPAGCLARDGTNYSRTGVYAPLFNEVGTTWGVGDGTTTFGVGDDRRRVLVGSGGAGTATLAATVGSTGGEEAHTNILTEQVAHTHSVGYGGAVAGAVNAAWGQANTYVGTFPTNNGVAEGGSGAAHNNIQPSAVVTSVIRYC